MSLRSAFAALLIVLLAAPSAPAQDQPDLWRDYARRFAPGSFVAVHMTNGRSLEGRLVRVTDEAVTVLPKTRIPVPARAVAFSRIQSIDTAKERMSPGAKVLIGVGVTAGVLLAIAAALFAAVSD